MIPDALSKYGCVVCASVEIEDVREAIMEQADGMAERESMDWTAIQIQIKTPFDFMERNYDMFECQNCGYLHLFRRSLKTPQKETQIGIRIKRSKEVKLCQEKPIPA